jgi:hypothetical protein
MTCRLSVLLIACTCTETYPLFESTEFAGGERVGSANDGDDIDARRQTAHQLNVHLSQAAKPM